MAKGKKNCPKCSLELGCRVLNCSCGYIFNSKKETVESTVPDIKQALSTEEDSIISAAKVKKEKKSKKNDSEVISEDGEEVKQFQFKTYEGTGNVEGTIKKRKTYERPDLEIERLMKDPEVCRIYPVPAGVPVEKLTAKEQAHQVLGLGKKRATSLLKIAQMEKYWRTVDWKYVAKELGEKVVEQKEEIEETEDNKDDKED